MTTDAADRLPEFSIVIPTFNRQARLNQCLTAIAALEYPRDRFEVIVVDDGSPQPAEEIVGRFRDHLDIRYLRRPHEGPAAARNAGARIARGDYLAFTDDDCAPSPGWLRAFAEALRGGTDCALGGRTLNALPENTFSQASQHLILYLYEYFNVDPHSAKFFASNNFAVLRTRFLAVGGFDPSFARAAAEDRELCDRWVGGRGQLVYVADAVVYHAHRLGFATFLRQHFSYGRGAFHFHRVRAARLRAPHTLEPISFYVGILHFPFRLERRWPAARIALLLVLSQAANAAGYAWEKLIEGRTVQARAPSARDNR
jgi:glycosyltransferase involved in cell wall biosynthesis